MPRKPKGSYARLTPDYHVDDLMCGGWYDLQQNNAQYGETGLFNNDGLGRRFYIYGLTIISDTVDICYFVIRSSATGSMVASGSNIDPSKGGGVGQIYLRRFGATEPPFVTIPPPANTVQVIGVDAVSSNEHGQYPLAIVPPGYQLSVVSSIQASEWAVGFWYVPL